MDRERFNKQIEFIMEIDKAKEVFRNTVLFDASRTENDAEHSWHMAIGAMLLSEYANEDNLDMVKIFKMVLIHDLVEIDSGDIFAYDEESAVGKYERELKAAERIFGLLPEDQAEEYLNLWLEFEDRITQEAKFAQAMDSFMPLLHNYKTKGLQWQRLNVTSDMVLSKNKKIKEGSTLLWNYIKDIIYDAVEKGYLD